MSTELPPYNRGGRDIAVNGVDVVLTPKAGLSLAMAIHALASNAAKYGSLSIAAGPLAVCWTVGDSPERTLKLVWEETGGPPLDGPPVRRGFGTTVIERTLTHEFDGAFLPSGLRCTIDLPLTAAVGEVRSGHMPGGGV